MIFCDQKGKSLFSGKCDKCREDIVDKGNAAVLEPTDIWYIVGTIWLTERTIVNVFVYIMIYHFKISL